MKVAAILLVGLLLVAALAWNAAERHYENCIGAAKAETSGTPTPKEAIENVEGRGKLERRVQGCSRLPW